MCLIYIRYMLAILRLPGSAELCTIFSEDVRSGDTAFFHGDGAYFAKQHLKHQNLLFAPPPIQRGSSTSYALQGGLCL